MFHQPLLLFAAITVLAPMGISQGVQALQRVQPLGGGCWPGPGPTVSGPMGIGTYVRFDDLGPCTPYNWGCMGYGCSGDGYLLLGLPGSGLPFPVRLLGGGWGQCALPFDPSVLVVVPGWGPSGWGVPIQLQIPNNASLVGFVLAAAGACTRLDGPSYTFYDILTPAIAVTIGP